MCGENYFFSQLQGALNAYKLCALEITSLQDFQTPVVITHITFQVLFFIQNYSRQADKFLMVNFDLESTSMKKGQKGLCEAPI